MSKSPRNSEHEKRLQYLRDIGVNGYTDAGPVQARLRYLHDVRGVTWPTIVERTGLDRETIVMQYQGKHKRGPDMDRCRKETERRVMGAKFSPADSYRFPAAGIRRRLRALYADGFTGPYIAPLLGVDYRNLHRVVSGLKSRDHVLSEFAQQVIDLYDKLSTTRPEDVGIGAQPASRSRNFARKNGYAPSACWDPDTIDDPAAEPEWTGECGTLLGKRIHLRDDIPMCERCRTATGRDPLEGFSPAKLREHRERKGYSRQRLSDELGLNLSTIIYWETGRSKPGRQNKIDQLMALLDITFEDITEAV